MTPSSTLWFRSPASLGLGVVLVCLSGADRAHSQQTLLADGFDFPVGKPDASGFYRARGYRPNGHLGEDWNGRGGGNTDLGAPVYAVANGVVVYSENYREGWGNVVIIRHAYRERNGRLAYVDSLYGHLHERLVRLDERVRRGQQIGTIGTNNGMYWAHLHLEMRKNLEIGMDRSQFARDDRNYFCPTTFIEARRALPAEFRLVSVPRTGGGDLRAVEDPKSSLDRELSRFLASHQIQRRPETVPEEPEPVLSGLASFTAASDSPEAQEERAKIRAFWQRLRGA